MNRLPDPRWHRERGSSAMRFAVYIAIISAVVYGALYAYGSLRVGQIETTLSQRMSDSGRPTPTEPTIDEALIRQRLVTMAREEGAEARSEDIVVVIEPINETNFARLPMQARIAIGAVNKMKNWDADAAFLSIKMPFRAKWGPVKRELVVTRDSWVPKSALRQ